MMFHKFTTSALLLFCFAATASYAVAPQQYDERDRQQMMRPEPRPAIQQPASGREHQERQRHENQSTGQPASGFMNPQTINIDRLKPRSNSLGEYQFESVPTLTLQSPDPATQTQEQSPQNETIVEEPQQELSAEEVLTAVAPEAGENASEAEQFAVAQDGRSLFKIIEEYDRIIVIQVDDAPHPPSPPR